MLDNYYSVISKGEEVRKLENEIEGLENIINQKKSKNVKLANDYNKGKRLSMNIVIRLFTRSGRNYFSEWRLNTQRINIAEMERNLIEKKEGLNKLKCIQRMLEEQNDNLISENEQLRQSSIDGLEIATVLLL